MFATNLLRKLTKEKMASMQHQKSNRSQPSEPTQNMDYIHDHASTLTNTPESPLLTVSNSTFIESDIKNDTMSHLDHNGDETTTTQAVAEASPHKRRKQEYTTTMATSEKLKRHTFARIRITSCI